MPASKRRRIVGKQTSPEGYHETGTRQVLTKPWEQRCAVKTMVRDHWVARHMSAHGLRGREARRKLISEWADFPCEAKLRQLSFVTVPSALSASAADVKAQWQMETNVPLAPDEARVTQYRGTGTMFRWSGTWSLLQDIPFDSVDSLCVTLRVHPACVQLWEEFRAFFDAVQKKHGLARWTIALELHCEVTSSTGTPSVHFHMMFDSPRQAILSGTALQFKSSNPYVSSEAPKSRGRLQAKL